MGKGNKKQKSGKKPKTSAPQADITTFTKNYEFLALYVSVKTLEFLVRQAYQLIQIYFKAWKRAKGNVYS